MNIKLDAVPVNGTLQVREWTPREEQAAPDHKRSNGGSRSPVAELDDLPGTF